VESFEGHRDFSWGSDYSLYKQKVVNTFCRLKNQTDGSSHRSDKRVSFRTLTSNLGRASGVHDYIKERTIKIGKYIVETRKTVRVIAKEFGVSKSTVHKDLTERLPEINPDLANEVKGILDYHKSIRHLRGGEATKMKYQKEEKEGEAVK
jgi:putative DeoR family transcriptional regulator, stage III sporulation protein D